MKKFGIICATWVEAQLLHDRMEEVRETEYSGMKYYEGRIENANVVLCTCGVGKVNAALYTQILIDRFGVDAIVHTGIAGSMDETVRHLDVVVADGLTYYDVRKEQLRWCFPNQTVFFADKRIRDILAECAGADNAVTIRMAVPEDAEALLKIYAPYVEKTAVTFEYEVPSVAEFSDRIKRTLKKYPYLAAELDGEVVGYAYAGTFHERAAYDWAVETSIYVREDKKGFGIGRALYSVLEHILLQQNILNVNACIAYPAREDEYLTKDSVRFHEKLGYRMAGRFHQCGYKFGRWYDMVWMEKHLGSHPENPEKVIWRSEEALL